MTARTCLECGTALAADAHPTRKYCSSTCRYRHRDHTPERRAADAARHLDRYHTDPDAREAMRTADRNRKRAAAGIPIDAPLANSGRHRIETQGDTMTDHTKAEQFDDRARDIAAVLITRPTQRETLLEHLVTIGGDSATVATITLRILDWVDELLLPREADSLHADLEARAEIAIATTPQGLAALSDEERL